MKKIPERYRSKIETIKKAVLIRSGLLSQYKNDIKIELINYDFAGDEEITFYELVFLVTIKNGIECLDCSHETDDIIEIIQEIQNKLYEAGRFKLDNDLNVKSGNSLRGSTVDGFSYHFDEIKNLEIGIYYDIDSDY